MSKKTLLTCLLGAMVTMFLLASCMGEEGDAQANPLGKSARVLASQSIALGALVQAEVSALECENAPGPYIRLDGEVVLGGLTARLVFTNNRKWFTHVHEEDLAVVDQVVIRPEEAITIPKQPVLGGSGGNPFIWVQFLDGEGSPLTDEIFLGRCVQGLAGIDEAVSLMADALVLDGTVTDCTNNPGPYITLDAKVVFAGLTVRFIFRNNDNPVGGPHSTVVERTVDMPVIAPGESIVFPKQPVLGGVGGNPWIFLQLLGGGGQPLGDPMLLGRCVQLQPGN